MGTGKVAIVTGSGRGIGAGIAERLSADGHAVAVLDLDTELAEVSAAKLVAGGGTAIAVTADVSSAEQVAAAVAEVTRRLGAPTILVNNAGVTRDALLFKMTEIQWDTVLDVHLKGTFLMTREVQKYMVDAAWGRVVNITSISNFGNRGQINYSSAKAGLLGFTKTAAIELGKYGITVNAVGPGFIVSDMTRNTAAQLNIPWDEYLASRITQIPVNRAGQPSDIANAVSFFTDDRSGFVSGQVIWVAGGPKG
jgi:3-oxoacyl-[acyl-carrier protein] reductase